VSSHPRAADGQASLEWLAIVALVATLLALGAAAAQAGFVGRQVTREMARALCRVGAGHCETDREPCVVAAARERTGMSISLAVVRFGGHQVGLFEQRSDGTVAVTVGDEIEGGVTAGVGARVGALGLSLGGTLGASVAAQLDHGRTWIVDSMAAAHDVVARYRAGRLDQHAGGTHRPAAPSADITYDGVQVLPSARVEADAKAVITLAQAGGGLSFDRRARQSLDRRTGHRTIYVQSHWSADGAAKVTGVLDTSGTAAPGGGERYAVELDAAGRPLDLQVIAAGEYAASADLPGIASEAEGLLEAPTAGTRLYEVTAHLDLTDPVNLAASRDVLRAIARGVASAPEATGALRRRIEQFGTVEARVLDQAGTSRDVGGELALGARVGFDYTHATAATRLLSAASRGLDGRWLPRRDCEAAATSA